MEVRVRFSEEPTIEERLIVQDKLSQGDLDVYKVFSPTYNQTYAIKLFPRSSFGMRHYQKEKLMSHLNHLNVIQQVPIIYSRRKCNILLTKFAPYGDFLDLVKNQHLDNEVLKRTYFRQLIEGIEHIHSQGVAHLDLKLENLMMGEDFNLKIIDFDHAQPIKDNVIRSKGTNGYRAPELISKTGSNLAAIDIYAAGIILFMFKVRALPFEEIKEDGEKNNYFSYYTYNQSKSYFWKMNKYVSDDKKAISKDFIQLVDGMLTEDPEKRMTIEDIKKTKWYKGRILELKTLQKEMITRLGDKKFEEMGTKTHIGSLEMQRES